MSNQSSEFEEMYEIWLSNQIEEEKNSRRRELLREGLGHGTVEFLRRIWYPAVKILIIYMWSMKLGIGITESGISTLLICLQEQLKVV